MKPTCAVLVLLASLTTPLVVCADYLEVRRPVSIKSAPQRDATELLHPDVGTYLQLLSDTETNGYYNVAVPDSGEGGWIYRTFVRRYPGSPPQGGTASTAALALATGGQGAFKVGCQLPFAEVAPKQPLSIDKMCSADGSGTTAPKIAESRAKNNFCAAGPPVTVTFDNFVALQSTAEKKRIPSGNANNLPPDRSVLQDLVTLPGGRQIGEGTVVQFAAFVNDAHYSNVSNGELVNCKIPGQSNNDIHIALTISPNENDLCNSITAEIPPHFRPKPWTGIVNNTIHRPMRVTGQLFFDASHVPCRGDKGANPARASVWEIHPVYALAVCKNTRLSACRVDDESAWISFQNWQGEDTDEEE